MTTSMSEATIESHTTPLADTLGDLYFRHMAEYITFCGKKLGRDEIQKIRWEADIIDDQISTITVRYQKHRDL